ncbi:MAG: hypothetical protein Kow0029_23610 [Candidatus Rifleibacteriota bacterium]
MRKFALLMTLFVFFTGFNGLLAETDHHNHNHGHNHSAMTTPMEMTKQTSDFPKEIVEVVPDKCPIMGGEINKAVFSVYKGHIYYFCCPGCINAFEADPEKYIDKFKDAPTKSLKVTNKDGLCPISGKAANMDFFMIDDEKASITFYHDEESLKKASEE